MFRRKKLNKEDNKEMCLYPKMIKNPKYLPNKKNNNNPPEITALVDGVPIIKSHFPPVGSYRDWETDRKSVV